MAASNNERISKKSEGVIRPIKLIIVTISIVYCIVFITIFKVLDKIPLHMSTDKIGEKFFKTKGGENKHEVRYHVVFSTDCSDFQHWQSYLLFYSAFKVRQPGRVTRIASGCNERQISKKKKWHKKHINKKMSSRFGIHFTPDFKYMAKGNTEYAFFNKPFGLLHWMEHGDYIGVGDGSNRRIDDDAIVILLDPDMVLHRPITNNFENDFDTFAALEKVEKLRPHVVRHGVPFAQLYGYGSEWLDLNIKRIAGLDSLATNVSQKDGGRLYTAGPPYVITARDMYQLALKWTEFVPKVYKEYPDLMAEMYAYSIAAAHLNLPHTLMHTLMISDPSFEWEGGEGFSLIRNLASKDVCDIAFHIDDFVGPLPRVLHYCQRYMVGNWFFAKPSFPRNFFSCETPLLEVPPMDIAIQFDYRMPPPPHPIPGEKKPMNQERSNRETFLLCRMISVLNELSEFYKDNHCTGVNGTRREKSMNQWKLGDWLGQIYTSDMS